MAYYGYSQEGAAQLCELADVLALCREQILTESKKLEFFAGTQEEALGTYYTAILRVIRDVCAAAGESEYAVLTLVLRLRDLAEDIEKSLKL